MNKMKRPIALFVACAFFSLIQLAAMPLSADQAPEPAGIAAESEDQAPNFVEEATNSPTTKKKSIVPMILIGVGVAAAAAVLFLVVLKTKYDLRGSWSVTRSDDFWWISNPRTFVFVGESRSSGTMSITGFTDVGPWTADGKTVNFTFTTNASLYLWTFTGTFSDKDTISGTVNYHDANYDINGTWTATRSAAAAAAPQPAFASEIKPDRDDR